MDELIDKGFHAAWGALLLYWIVSARNVKAPQKSLPPVVHIVLFWMPLLAAFHLLGSDDADGELGRRFLPGGWWPGALGLAVTVAGVALACWSRHLLGRNWSGGVQIKHDHELIEDGPYRHVRHPIYTGLLLAVCGAACRVGEVRGLVALAVVGVSFWIKLRYEERFLIDQFGERYLAYMRRTRALVPGLL